MQFPSDLSAKYYFDLKFMKYSRPNAYTGTVNLSTPAVDASSGSASIRLPIPSNLINTQKLDWAQANNIGGIIEAGASLGSMNIQGAENAQSGMQRALAGAGAALGSKVSSMFWGQAGDPMQYALQNSGLAMNPVLTQMFKNPEFKEHMFSWTLAPEDDTETYTLQAIVDTINQMALPDISTGGAFFTYPSIAIIQIHAGNYGNIYNIQPCVVTSVSANFAPKGLWSPFTGTNGPTEVKIDVSFLEIVLNTRSNQNPATAVSGFDFSLAGIGNTAIKTLGLQAVNGLL